MIGDLIKQLRLQKGITQTELAKAVHTTKQTIYKYEAGIVTNIPLDRIQMIADYFGVTSAYLMGWNDDPPSPEEEDVFKTLFDQLSPADQNEIIKKMLEMQKK